MGIKLVIVGGVAGGATAAARAKRVSEDAEIVVFERGEYISFANCGLPYYIGNVIKKRADLLLASPEHFKQRYNIDVRIFSEVVGINPKEKVVEIKDTTTGKTYLESYDKLILSPGAEPIKPPLEGIDLDNIFHLRNIPDSDRIKKIVDERNPHCAVVVGGGFIGLEMAENLTERGVKTTIVEMLDQVMPPLDYEMAALIHEHLEAKNVELELENAVKSFSKANDRILVSTQKGHDIECDLVLLSVGIRPENTLAKQADLKIGPTGGIAVDDTMRTSDPDIYAVGDAVEVRDIVTGFPTLTALAGPANKQARIAADNALGRKSLFTGTLGTSVVKVFDVVLASTGANEKFLRKHDIPYLVSYTHSGSHAGYYPGATNTSIKVLFSPGTGKVLGAQIVGKKGVDKRIDVLATAIRAKMTVYDLEELELAYAPPYSSAKDPINICGFVAANILKGDMAIVQWSEIESLLKNGAILIDLRTKFEFNRMGNIEGALHIYIDELRGRLSELDKEKTYIPYCGIGFRGYLGHRILVQNGFKSKNLSGGFMTYAMAIRGH
ncbi:MAG: FAD-dependent oxidoreductase [Deltaproteobacteria bacterium]|jgi:NADPH-dependent 2,4-dienoyl-CoA reductase/sulfur reductase-like enzyme/rhodanese-related sulfurtransferase|nr:FAD-dependent oxidoreductase [Deltaproteobacteria bacterium]